MCIWIYTKCVSKGHTRDDTVFHHPEDKTQIRTAGSKYGLRHVQCLMASLAVTILMSLRFNLSVAIVCMTEQVSSNSDVPVLPWTEQMKGVVLSANLWSYPLLQIPAGQLAERFGPKFLILSSVFFSGLLAVLTPLLVVIDEAGFYLMILIRVLQGLVQGVFYPATNFLLSRWIPTPERGRLVNFVYSGDRLGIFGTMAISGVLGDSRWGWPSIFYVTGGIAILWSLIFLFLGADSPQRHKTISQSERDYIMSSLPDSSAKRSAMSTPWKAIWTSTPVWALILAHSGQHWGYSTMAVNTPAYIDGVFGFDIKKSGFLSSIPHVLSYIVGFGFAALNDRIINQKTCSKAVLRRIWNSVALWGGALGMCVLAFAGTNEILALSSLAAAVVLNSAINLSVMSNHLDLCPNFAGTLIGITTGISCIAATMSVLTAGFIVNDTKSLFQWQMVFLLGAVVFFVSNVIFILFGKAEVQQWNNPTKTQKPIPS